jgi:hypothetical protein
MTKIPEEKRRRRSQAQVAALVSDLRRSGLDHAAYAQKVGMKLGTLRSMMYRQRPERTRAGFAAVQLTDTAPSGAVVTIRWPQGVAVDLPLALGEANLRSWLGEWLAPCLR